MARLRALIPMDGYLAGMDQASRDRADKLLQGVQMTQRYLRGEKKPWGMRAKLRLASTLWKVGRLSKADNEPDERVMTES
jgi:hypothetical protein